MKNEVKTLADAIRYFSDEQTCIDTVAFMRWPTGPECPACLMPRERQHWLKNQRRWQCRECGRQYSVKLNTIFEDSAIPLQKWLPAMWLLANCKNGISSYEIARSIGVTQKSAWFMLHRIREAMKNRSIKKLGPSGKPVEVDETFVGGKMKNMHASRRNKLQLAERGDSKTAILGMLDRYAREVRVKVIPDVTRATLQAEILRQIVSVGTIYTDQHSGYDGLKAKAFIHKTVNHLEEYVRKGVHTQGIENFWSLLKRSLNGTYVAVEPFHLEAYADEQAFRYNNRATKDNPVTDADRFALAVSQIAGKRLTYAELTGKVGERAF
ncbi:MAG: IS1595 family transposase [Terracidiphilus sp.]|jgi:transposase-like protein